LHWRGFSSSRPADGQLTWQHDTMKPVVHCTGLPNHAFDRSAQRHRRWVPVALRAPAPGQCKRWAPQGVFEGTASQAQEQARA
jgi:hypothetical protein